MVIKVLLVDDHEIIRTGMKLMLQNVEDMKIIGEARNGEEAIKFTRELSPDVVIMDINMPGIGGLEATLRISRNNPPPKVLVVSTYTNDIIPARLIGMGVSGYLTKQADQPILVEAIRKVYGGGRYIEASILDKISKNISGDGIVDEVDKARMYVLFADLSERELQILLMVARGMDAAEISKKLYLTNKTVNGYRNGILKKLGVKTDVEAARIAIGFGLVDADVEWH